MLLQHIRNTCIAYILHVPQDGGKLVVAKTRGRGGGAVSCIMYDDCMICVKCGHWWGIRGIDRYGYLQFGWGSCKLVMYSSTWGRRLISRWLVISSSRGYYEEPNLFRSRCQRVGCNKDLDIQRMVESRAQVIGGLCTMKWLFPHEQNAGYFKLRRMIPSWYHHLMTHCLIIKERASSANTFLLQASLRCAVYIFPTRLAIKNYPPGPRIDCV